MRGVETPLPTVQDVIDLTVRCGSLTNPGIRCIGIAVNTSALGEAEAREFLAMIGEEHALPATDPVRFGMEAIVDRVEAEFGVP